MNIKAMNNTPSNRSDFERNFNILSEKMKARLINFSANGTVEGLKKVRALPNGRINFLTVNESARLTANMITNMPQMIENEKKHEEEKRK